eukprot:UN01963
MATTKESESSESELSISVDSLEIKNAEEEKVESKRNLKIYMKNVPKDLMIDRNYTIAYYIKLAATILRSNNEIIISGKGVNTSIAVSLVEALKRQKLANVISIKTGMDVSDFFAKGDPSWSQPCAMMTFYLSGGEYAQYISGFEQRKMIEIFERIDSECSGYLNLQQIRSLQFGQRFRATKIQIKKSQEFLLQFEKEQQLNLPNFIKYASLLIHPLLGDAFFKRIVLTEFKLM